MRHILDMMHLVWIWLMMVGSFFQLAGGTVLALGMWTLIEKSKYISLLNSSFYSASTYILIVAGLIVIMTGIIGCVATLKEMKSLLIVVRCLSLIKHCPSPKHQLHLIMLNQKTRKDIFKFLFIYTHKLIFVYWK